MHHYCISYPLKISDLYKIEEGRVHQILPAAFNGRLKHVSGKSVAFAEAEFAADDVFACFFIAGDDHLVDDRSAQLYTVEYLQLLGFACGVKAGEKNQEYNQELTHSCEERQKNLACRLPGHKETND